MRVVFPRAEDGVYRLSGRVKRGNCGGFGVLEVEGRFEVEGVWCGRSAKDLRLLVAGRPK